MIRTISSNIKKYCGEHKIVLENLSYMFLLQLFLLCYPLITYPYLVKVLGKELYGVILTAQMLASYASLFIDFGSNYVCAKHVSINRGNKAKLSEILSNVLFVRFVIFLIVFILFGSVSFLVPSYRTYFLIFILTYGFSTNDLLFPQFFFQGLEKMKTISLISMVTKIIMVLLIFVLVKSADDAILVPIIYSIGYVIGGIISLYMILIKMNIKFVKPTIKVSLYYLKDCSSIFATDLICTIKDRFSYFLVGIFVGMEEVVIYDLGLKLNAIVGKPFNIICTVLFPRIAKSRSLKQVRNTAISNLIITLLIVIVANLFLKEIVIFFLHEECDLLPLRILLIAPLLLSVSYVLSNNLFVAFGYNRYVFYSIVFTTLIYLGCLIVFYCMGMLNSVMSFILVAIISFAFELLYRLFLARKAVIKEKNLGLGL